MVKRLLKIIGWSLLWLAAFWAFLIISFPAETAKNWLTNKLEKGLKAKASIEELSVRWNFGIRLKGVSIERQPLISQESSSTIPLPHGEGQGEGGFTISLNSVNIKPGILSLIRFKPEMEFSGSPASGGSFNGSHAADSLSISFKDVLFKDFTIATLPLPSTTVLSGSGKLKLVKGKGAIEIEVNGIPGGKQKAAMPGGEGPGLDGKLKVTVSMPGI